MARTQSATPKNLDRPRPEAIITAHREQTAAALAPPLTREKSKKAPILLDINNTFPNHNMELALDPIAGSPTNLHPYESKQFVEFDIFKVIFNI
jgi:hypothetical protein